MYVCVHMHVLQCVYECVYYHVWLCMCESKCVHVYVCMHVCALLCGCKCMLCICADVNVCYTCEWLYMWVWVMPRKLQDRGLSRIWLIKPWVCKFHQNPLQDAVSSLLQHEGLCISTGPSTLTIFLKIHELWTFPLCWPVDQFWSFVVFNDLEPSSIALCQWILASSREMICLAGASWICAIKWRSMTDITFRHGL